MGTVRSQSLGVRYICQYKGLKHCNIYVRIKYVRSKNIGKCYRLFEGAVYFSTKKLCSTCHCKLNTVYVCSFNQGKDRLIEEGVLICDFLVNLSRQ
jgi:hypothetical protein